MFLNDDELFDLTGYRRNADKCRWLDKHGWKYARSAITGRPAVSRAHAEFMLSGAQAKADPKLNMKALRG